MSNMEEMKAIACFPEALKITKTNGKNLILFLLVVLIPINLLSMLANHLLPPTLLLDFFPTPQISQQYPYTPPINNQATKVEVNFVSSLLSMLSTLAMVYFSAMACSGEKTTLKVLFLKARRTWWRPTITLFYVMLFTFPPLAFLLMLIVPGLIEKIVYFLGSSFLIVMILFSGFMVLWFLLLSFAQRWGIVSSILEEGSYGMEAMKKSLVFMRRRKLQVFLLFLLSLPQEFIIFKLGTYMITGEVIQIAWALPLYLLGRIYHSLVYTVFFCYNNY